ncbi:hypothetical protein D3C78_1701770 [compost metagenome]
MTAEKLGLQGLHCPVLMGLTFGASEHCLIQQGTLRMADKLDAMAIQALLLKRGPNMLDIRHATRPKFRATVHTCAMSQLDHQQVGIL